MSSPPPSSTPPLPVLVLVRDLIFSSRITATARSAGVDVRLVRDDAQLDGIDGRKMIVDLNQPGAIAAAQRWKGRTGRPVVGFVSHVDVDTTRAARDAGIEVLPRSRFVNELLAILHPPARPEQ